MDKVKVEGHTFVRDTQVGGDHYDKVNHPSHYKQGGVECIEAIRSAVTTAPPIQAVFAANILKYVWRYREKNGIQDLMKARWYLDELIKEVCGYGKDG